jgi:hypothetical protein
MPPDAGQTEERLAANFSERRFHVLRLISALSRPEHSLRPWLSAAMLGSIMCLKAVRIFATVPTRCASTPWRGDIFCGI